MLQIPICEVFVLLKKYMDVLVHFFSLIHVNISKVAIHVKTLVLLFQY